MFIILCPIYRARDDKQTYNEHKTGNLQGSGFPFLRHAVRFHM